LNTRTHERIALIGTGAMGTAIARVLLKRNHWLVVWNRTLSRCNPLRATGAQVAATPLEAAANCDVLLICTRHYGDAHALISSDRIISALQGKLVVQLTTGSPAEVRALDAWANENDIRFLDAKIFSSPANIGTDAGTILFSGSASTFHHHKDLLGNLGAKPKYLGNDIGAASTLDLAVLSHMYGSSLAFMQAAAICNSEQLPLSVLESTLDDLGLGGRLITRLASMIASGNHQFQGWATVDTHRAAMEHIVQLCKQNGLDSSLPDLLSLHLTRATTAGHGGDELTRLYELLKPVQ
jgi:3-hydroxyisobutyrate dehydrogenase-like beta-hydroxyacid dehydrogenase